MAASLCRFSLLDRNDTAFPKEVVWINSNLAFPSPPFPVSYTAEGDFRSLVIPVKRAGNLILMDAIVDSLPGNLILDTGASGMVLNGIYFRDNSFAVGRSAGGVTGTTGELRKANISHLQISEMYFEDITADVTDLGHIENARNVKILGLLGLNMFSELEVVIDLAGGVMELHRLDRDGERIDIQSKRPRFDLDIPVRYNRNILFMEGEISGKRLTFCLDSGAESNVLHSMLPGKVLNTVSINRRSSLRGVGSASVEVLFGVMNEFFVGEHAFPGMQTIVTNLSAMSNAYGIQIDGMLGCDFLDKGIFFINLEKKELGICFNKENRE